MELQPLEIVLYLSLFTAVFGFISIIMGRLQEVGEDLQEAQIEAGDSTLGELYINISPETFFHLRLLLAAVLFFVGLTSINVICGLMIAFGAYIIPGMVLKNLKEKRIRKLETQLVDGLELMGNGLKSGLTLIQAVELLVKEFPAPISQEFNLVLAENRLGVEFTEALDNMSKRLNSMTVSILVTGVAITKRCGGDLTEIFTNIADTIREQSNVEGKLNAVTAQGRFQGQILSFMPFALMIVLYFVDKSHVETLFNYTIGLWAVGSVIGMVCLAQIWIAKLLAIDV